MRVILWTESFWPRVGGVQVLAGALLRSLKQRGHALTVVTLQHADDPRDAHAYYGVPVHRYPFVGVLQQNDPSAILRLGQQVVAQLSVVRPDLVHVYQPGAGSFFCLRALERLRVPLLVTLHGPVEPTALRAHNTHHHLLQSADWVAACSRATLAEVHNQFPEITSRTSVIRNGLRMPRQAPTPLDFERPRLLCLGRLAPRKGFDIGLRAFARVLERFPQARLLVAGDGEERQDLDRLAVALGVTAELEVLGEVDPADVTALINSATLVLVPSRTEGFSLVALQAAQMARPVVATRVDGLPEVVVDGKTGMVVPPDDDASLAEAIVSLLNDPERAITMGHAARQRARDEFSWRPYIDAYAALYDLLAGTKSGEVNAARGSPERTTDSSDGRVDAGNQRRH